MDRDLIIGIGICCFAIAILFFTLILSSRNDIQRLEKENKEIDDYLKTVIQRINLSKSNDALILLNKEMGIKFNSFKFTERSYLKWNRVFYYLIGKIVGLDKSNIGKIIIKFD